MKPFIKPVKRHLSGSTWILIVSFPDSPIARCKSLGILSGLLCSSRLPPFWVRTSNFLSPLHFVCSP